MRKLFDWTRLAVHSHLSFTWLTTGLDSPTRLKERDHTDLVSISLDWTFQDTHRLERHEPVQESEAPWRNIPTNLSNGPFWTFYRRLEEC